jgi:hypothetical protein
MEYSKADFDNIFSASSRTSRILHDNPYSISISIVSKQFSLAAMLFPPMPSFDDIDEWLPMLAEKSKAVNKARESAGADENQIHPSNVISENSSGDVIDITATAHIATTGIYTYEKISMYGEVFWDEDENRINFVNKGHGLLLLKLRFTTLWLMDLIRIVRRDVPLRIPNVEMWSNVSLSSKEHQEALEVRLFKLGPKSVLSLLATNSEPDLSTVQMGSLSLVK